MRKRKETRLETLRRYRKERGWTQEQLAERSGIPRPNISKYETGERDPRAETASKLARALGVTVDELLDPEPVWLVEVRKNTGKYEEEQRSRGGLPLPENEAVAGLPLFDMARWTEKEVLNNLKYFPGDLSPAQLREALDIVGRLILVQDRELHQAKQQDLDGAPAAREQEVNVPA